jgi:hypothetical protein
LRLVASGTRKENEHGPTRARRPTSFRSRGVAAVRFATTRTRTFDADSNSHLLSVSSSRRYARDRSASIGHTARAAPQVAERNASQARFGRSFARDRHYGMPAAECCFVRHAAPPGRKTDSARRWALWSAALGHNLARPLLMRRAGEPTNCTGVDELCEQPSDVDLRGETVTQSPRTAPPHC